jgi:hypothetical protein
MPLYLDTGFAVHSPNRDGQPYMVVVPGSDEPDALGALAVLASGVPNRPQPDDAAHAAASAFGTSYFTTPEDWSAEQAAQESFRAADQAVRGGGERGRAASLSGLVLRHRQWVLIHAGNTRAWRMRDRTLKLLSRDHIEPRVNQAPNVKRACGLGDTVTPDLASGNLALGDIYLITGHGVHDLLDGSMILSCLMGDVPAGQMAECLTSRAAAAGGTEAVTACVVRVESLPPETDSDMARDLASLPVMAPPEIGATVDGFKIDSLLHKSHSWRLYRATDTETEARVVIKVPNPKLACDPTFARVFLREEWIGKRVNSAHVVRVLPLRSGRRTALYSVLADHEGENLAERISRKGSLSVKESLYLAKQLARALDDLHRHGVIHRDIRPKNIVYDRRNKHLLLIGLGSSRVEPLQQATEGVARGAASLSYLAPECFSGRPVDACADIYAAGVTIYHMLTNRYPYGKIASQASPPGGTFISAARHKAEVPPWLDDVLLRACATDPIERFQNASELVTALEAGAHIPAAQVSRNAPAAAETHPAPHWQWLLLGSAVLALMIYLMLLLRG